MALEGFVEAVEPFQVRGWVYDASSPQHNVVVELFLREEMLGTTVASLYREDLEKNGVGTGDHAFIFNLHQKLEESNIPNVTVRAIQGNGSFEALPKLAKNPELPIERSLLTFDGLSVDVGQKPVFVLGAARSGTSAVAQALLKLSRFAGHQEGHLLDLLAHLSVALKKFYIEKSDDQAPGRDTMVARVPEEYFQRTLDAILIQTVRKVFPGGAWVDKTPNSNMIYLAPRLRQIWPNSRFIFMKRRALENLASRSVKFPTVDFDYHCREWSRVMSAWLDVKGQLAGAAIELDQNFLNANSEASSQAMRKLLDLSDIETARLHQALEFDHPERTSTNKKSIQDLGSMGWSQNLQSTLFEICGEMMRAYGYSDNAQYYAAGFENNGLIFI